MKNLCPLPFAATVLAMLLAGCQSSEEPASNAPAASTAPPAAGRAPATQVAQLAPLPGKERRGARSDGCHAGAFRDYGRRRRHRGLPAGGAAQRCEAFRRARHFGLLRRHARLASRARLRRAVRRQLARAAQDVERPRVQRRPFAVRAESRYVGVRERRGPNTNSTQVFESIIARTTAWPRPQFNFTTFGQVVEGMDVVDKFSQVGDPSGGLDENPRLVRWRRLPRVTSNEADDDHEGDRRGLTAGGVESSRRVSAASDRRKRRARTARSTGWTTSVPVYGSRKNSGSAATNSRVSARPVRNRARSAP